MIKKFCMVGIIVGCIILSGCTVKTKNGELYINTDERETKTYHFVEKNLLDKETFLADIEIGNVEMGLSNRYLYDVTIVVRYNKEESPKAPKIEDLGDTIMFSVPVGDIHGTIGDTFKNLNFEMNIGNAKLFLNSGSFENLDVDINIGNVEVFLPEEGEGTANIKVNTGAAKIIVNKDTGYILHYTIGIGAVSIDSEKDMIGEGTYRINPEKDVKYEIWIDVGTGHIEVIE
ncbi:MAG: hypothetical protein J7L10_05285 [Methanomicrobia archaeon]|nr:hypothetical protein [Methanomicrobia archaeon]